MLSALPQARSDTEIRRLLLGWIDLIHVLLREPDGHNALGLVLRCLLEVRGVGELAVIDTTLREITAENGEVMQTIAQMLESRGMERGLQPGTSGGPERTAAAAAAAALWRVAGRDR